MPNPAFAATAIAMLLAGPAAAPDPAAPNWDMAAAALQHITVHVPRVTVTRTTTIITTKVPIRPPMYREKKADDCVKTKKLTGFTVTTNDSVDLILEDGKRLRARLGSDCRALGFYAGFYIKPHPDGKTCAGRDTLRSRSGTSCGIQEFKSLVPVKVKEAR